MTVTVGSEVAGAGDEVARLYDLYASKLRRFCLGRLRSAEDADDAVQTVFLRVYTALRGGTVPAYEGAWLYKIAHNVCLSRLESGAARARVEQPCDLDRLGEMLAAPGGRHDELAGLADALAAMPPNLRQAILLREWQGLSYAEIAEALGVSVSAVETLIFRARRHLASALERGVVAPARSALTLLQLPWLLRRLRSLLATGRGAQIGAAKLSAAAVVGAVAAGGGVATSVLATRTPARTSTATAAPSPARSAVAATSVAVVPPVHATAAGPTRRRPAARRAVVLPASTSATIVRVARPTATVPATEPATIVRVARPTATVPATEPVPPAGTTGVVPTTAAPTLSVPTAAAPTAPTVTAPAPVVPTVSVPTVSTPTASVPPVAVPTVTVPVVTTPVATVAAPAVAPLP